MWRMRIARWITKTTNAHLAYVILTAFHNKNAYMKAPHNYIICCLPSYVSDTE